jgi:protein disulfide-isomerase A1
MSIENSVPGLFAALRLTNINDRIAQFLERMDRPIVTDLTSQALPTFSTIDDIVVIAQMHPEDKAFLGHFHEVAGDFRDRYTFAISNLPQGSSSTNRVLCRNNLDDIEHLSGDLDRVGALEELIEKCATPLILPLTRRNEMIFNKARSSSLPPRRLPLTSEYHN